MTWNGQNSGVLLLGFLLLFYIYFLPALLAFLRGHSRFWPILGLNVLVAPVQVTLFQYFFPLQVSNQPYLTLAGISFLEIMGPGWLLILLWALSRNPLPDARLLAARDTKLFDFFAALPLVVWFANSAMQQRPQLAQDGAMIAVGTASPFIWIQFFAVGLSMLFCFVTVYLLLVRDKPVRRLGGLLPRLCAVTGTFLGVGILRLPVAELGMSMQTLAAILIGVGSGASVLILWRLGKSFSILPEARRLVTSGPYAYARHPLYAAEMVTIVGMAIQYQQSWAALLGACVIALQVIRSLFEERVLGQAFPGYAEYRARTKRFIPGVI